MKYYKIYKPFGMLSQFSDSAGKSTLKDLFNFPVDVYSVGRLDYDSEGLLLLTNDKTLTNFLLNPSKTVEKEYFVQVEGIPAEKDLRPLREGIYIDRKKTLPAKAEIIGIPRLPERIPPVRFRKNVPDTWIKIVITEGRNRQVRKMTARIGFPTLRLVRIRIKNILLGDMKPGEVRELGKDELEKLKAGISPALSKPQKGNYGKRRR